MRIFFSYFAPSPTSFRPVISNDASSSVIDDGLALFFKVRSEILRFVSSSNVSLTDLHSCSITQSSSKNADQNRPDSFSFQLFKMRAVRYVNLGDRFNQLFHQCFSRCARVGDRGRYKLLKRILNP